MNALRLAVDWTEQGLLPDSVVRAGIRRLLRRRLEEIGADDAEACAVRTEAFLQEMASAPVAPIPHKPNEQHYELPAEFFGLVLGPRRKYSACYWPAHVARLDEAEAAALAATCERAGLADGMDVLELGCGWGSLTLWIAERYPACRITAVSNSASQRA
ncbi:MAG: class I SAM-dependent methyltransferase, partial [Burkholderiales bacterium]|nr:class I SAM-dependent methyltransferase [Burkholderiales bacterium]